MDNDKKVFKMILFRIECLNDGDNENGENRGDYNAQIYIPDFAAPAVIAYQKQNLLLTGKHCTPDYIYKNINIIVHDLARPLPFRGKDLKPTITLVKTFIAHNFGIQTYPPMCLN